MSTQDAARESAYKTRMVPVSAIFADPARFQNRDTEFSETSVARIIEGYDPNKLDPITIWTDPADGKIYVLSGHSRLEAFRRMGKKEIPAKYFVGPQGEAIRFARVDANRSATSETIAEDVKAYKYERDELKETRTALQAKWREKYAKMEAYSHLERGGMFMDALQKPAGFPYILNKAMWVGTLRKYYPQITNTQEREMFNYLYFHANGSKLKAEEFQARAEEIVSRLDFDPSKPLNLDKSRANTGVEARADTAESQRRLKEVEAELTKLAERQRETVTEAEKDVIRAQRQRLMLEKERLERDIKVILQSQGDLFSQMMGFAPGPREAIVASASKKDVPQDVAAEKAQGSGGKATPGPAAPTAAQLQARLNVVALALELEDDPAAVKQLTARKNILELAIELA